jgi:uncharacterized protein (TIGR02271 family)
MDNTMNQWQTQFREGDDVIASDGEKLGSIQSIGPNYMLVEKGFFFVTDYYVPFTAVSSYDTDGGKVYLSMTKDEALNSGWDVAPETDTSSQVGRDPMFMGDGTTQSGMAGTTTDSSMAAGADAYATGNYSNVSDVETAGWDATGRSETGEHITVPVHEEELTATKRMREAGEVSIDKHVEAREQTLEVPVTEERVHVTRRAVDRDAAMAGEDVFVEERIDVPLRAEEVELQKRTRVAEEIEIDKEQVQRTERVSGTVRKEVVDVDDVAADASMRNDDMGRSTGVQ